MPVALGKARESGTESASEGSEGTSEGKGVGRRREGGRDRGGVQGAGHEGGGETRGNFAGLARRRTGAGPAQRTVQPGAGMQAAGASGILPNRVQRALEVSLPISGDVFGMAEDMLPNVEGE